MLIRIKDSRPGCSFYPGQLVRVGDRQAEEWIEQGLATEATDMWVPLNDDPRPSTDPIPPMKPTRKIDRKGNVLTRLNLGCGPDIREGFINLDIRPLDGVVVCDVSEVEQMHVYAGATEILAYDILEHFDRKTAKMCLAMWVSLLAPGGVLKLRCPDIRHAVTVAPNDEWLELLLYGGQDYPENFHKSGFTFATMKKLLEGMGLKVTFADQTRSGNLHVKAVK